MTEDEAKTKWCPAARITLLDEKNRINVPSYNRAMSMEGKVTENPVGTACIGSDCMAWRETKVDTAYDPVYGGYCGLAGKP